MGNILSWFIKPKQGSVYNPEGNFVTGTRDDPRNDDYDKFGGNNKTNKTRKNKIQKHKSFRRKK